MSPVEDLMLHLLREELDGVPVNSLIAPDQTFPLVLVRNTGAWGEWAGDERFLDAGSIVVHTFADGLNGDSDAALLAEAVRVVIRDSVNQVVPSRGHIVRQQMLSRPRRVTDWATATGPVQYADLPTGVWRYETVYQVEIRKSLTKPYAT